ncbi:MAG: questin oxidase family protein [Pseudomonadota bacterium]
MDKAYQHHDDILLEMRPYGCNLKNGFSNHTPMVIEALAALNHGHLAHTWFTQRKSGIALRPVSSDPITEENLRNALGQSDRFTDWMNYFSEQIDKRGWHATAARWVPTLGPGFLTAACHGVIRVGHAVRALRVKDTGARRQELAYALASWCTDYKELENKHTPAEFPLGPYNGQDLMQRLTLLDEDYRKNDGAITTAVGQLASHGIFLAQVQKLTFAQVNDTILAIAKTSADVFLHNARSTLGAIVFTHAITCVAAVRNIAPCLSEEHQRILIYEAFFAIAALHTVYATSPLKSSPKSSDRTPDEIVSHAVNHGDDHVIKLTEACINFYKYTQDDRFLVAADLGANLIPSAD